MESPYRLFYETFQLLSLNCTLRTNEPYYAGKPALTCQDLFLQNNYFHYQLIYKRLGWNYYILSVIHWVIESAIEIQNSIIRDSVFHLNWHGSSQHFGPAKLILKYRGVFRILSNLYGGAFCENR